MITNTIAIIGSGNMGASLVGGLIGYGFPPEKLWMASTNEKKLKALHQSFNVHLTTDNKTAASHADIIVLAVKPQKLAGVLQELAPLIQQRKPLVISIITGARASSIQKNLGGNIHIVRSMPNTPSLIGCGATALFANELVTQAERNTAESILRAVGLVVWLEDEKLLDAVTALSGSGPAYFFLFMEILQEVGEQLGLPTDVARLLTLQTGFGATRMALESQENLATLRQRVTSPGGTTEKALKVLEEKQLRQLLKEALQAAQTRATELAQLLDATEPKNA